MSHYPVHRKVGHYCAFADVTVCPTDLCFFMKHMSKTYIQIGTYNDHSQDHSKHVTVTVPAGTNVADIVRTFMTDDVEPVQEDTPDTASSIPPDFFRISERFPEENIRERLAAELSQATTKKDYCRGLYRLQHIGCIDIDQYASDAQRAKIFNRFQSKYNLSASDFCKARMN